MPLIGLYVVQPDLPFVPGTAHIVRSTAMIYDRYNPLRLEPKRSPVAKQSLIDGSPRRAESLLIEAVQPGDDYPPAKEL